MSVHSHVGMSNGASFLGGKSRGVWVHFRGGPYFEEYNVVRGLRVHFDRGGS